MPRSTRYALAVIAYAYGGALLLTLWAGESWPRWLLAAVIIGGLQNHLLILHHDGAHGLLHPRRRVNDFLANVFCGFPFFELLRPYREFHFAHHRLVTSEEDPELPFYRQQGRYCGPLTRGRRAWLGFLDLAGYHWLQFFVAFLRSLRDDARLFTMHDRPSFFGLPFLAAIVVAFPTGFFWFWLVPMVTVGFFFAKQRGLREHGERRAELEKCTFDVPAGPVARFFLFPLNAHFHLAHHRNPQLPWYELSRSFPYRRRA